MQYGFSPRAWLSYLRKHKVEILRQLRVAIPYLLVYVILVFVLNYFNISTDAVRSYFSRLGPVVIPAFILVQMTSSMTPLPDLPFTVAGIMFFPPAVAFGLILISMWLAAFINFFIARKFGRS